MFGRNWTVSDPRSRSLKARRYDVRIIIIIRYRSLQRLTFSIDFSIFRDVRTGLICLIFSSTRSPVRRVIIFCDQYMADQARNPSYIMVRV